MESVTIYAILGFSLLLILGFGIIMVYTFREVVKISGSSLRAGGVERRDFFQLLERMFEKKESSQPMMTSQIHRDERMHQVSLETEVAKEAVRVEEGKKEAKGLDSYPREELFAGPNDLEVQGGDGEPV